MKDDDLKTFVAIYTKVDETVTLHSDILAKLDGILREGETRERFVYAAIDSEIGRRLHKQSQA
jgi:hypothetical protein